MDAVPGILSADEPGKAADGGKDARQPERTRFVRDIDTSALVFQVVDPTWGEVLAQMPTESALRNRAYAAVARAMQAQRSEGLIRKV